MIQANNQPLELCGCAATVSAVRVAPGAQFVFPSHSKENPCLT